EPNVRGQAKRTRCALSGCLNGSRGFERVIARNRQRRGLGSDTGGGEGYFEGGAGAGVDYYRIATGRRRDGKLRIRGRNPTHGQASSARVANVERSMADASRADGPESNAGGHFNVSALRDKEEEGINRGRDGANSVGADEVR